jgi:Ca2+-binding RTX toxin-like protein
MSRLPLGVALAALLALIVPATAGAWNDDELYGITAGATPHLVSFAPVNPITFEEDAPISGLTAGDTVMGMDVSPRDGGLYLLTQNGTVGRLYSLDASAADATPVAQLTADPADTTAPYTGLTDIAYGVDFNPQSNLLRVVGGFANSNAQNLRVDPATGKVTTDVPITSGVKLAGIAYHNNDNDTSTPTVQYGYDFAIDAWGSVTTPNNGATWLAIQNNSAFATGQVTNIGLDEAPSGAMYETHFINASSSQRLYSVSNVAGPNPNVSHNLIGPVPTALVGLSAAVENLFGVDSAAITTGEGAGAARVTVTRRNASGTSAVNYATADAGAVAGTDYTATSGKLTFGPGEVAKTITIPITNDSTDESDKSFDLKLSPDAGSSNLLALVRTTTVTIADDDPAPVAEPPPPPPAADRDGDGKPDSTDNCPNVANGDQADRDGDGLGTVCDPVEPVPPLVGKCVNQRQGTAGEDSLQGTAEGDTLNGLGGADSLYGFAGADCLNGGPGGDWLVGGDGDDVIHGDAGADVLLGGAGNDTIATGAGKSIIVDAGAGNDTVNAKNGKLETIVCGAGTDTVKADKRDKLKGCEKRKR